jgi:hypothetical protein
MVTLLNFIIPLVGFQHQAGALRFDLCNDFHLVPHTQLLYKLRDFKLFGGYINWSRSIVVAYGQERESLKALTALREQSMLQSLGEPSICSGYEIVIVVIV